MDNSVLTPTPFLLDEETIRVFGSFRDKEGAGRIGYVDVESKNPSNVIRVSKEPVLDIGENGQFDDNGVILGDVIRHDNKVYMYYVGFQLVKKVKFLAFTGLAISEDGGHSFKRYQKTPIADRTNNASFIRAIHTITFEENRFRVWYAAGNDWRNIDGTDYPCYNIRYMESKDGITFDDPKGTLCLDHNSDEYRIGRPHVRKTGGSYEMRFTYDTLKKEYLTGVAHSTDGLSWVRAKEADLKPSGEGWDSSEVAYPVVIDTKYRTYMFYNGNGMGLTGFGYAEEVSK